MSWIDEAVSKVCGKGAGLCLVLAMTTIIQAQVAVFDETKLVPNAGPFLGSVAAGFLGTSFDYIEDVNGDRIRDMVVASRPVIPHITVVFLDGAGGVAGFADDAIPSISSTAPIVAGLGDFDLDGVGDFMVGSHGGFGGSIILYLLNASGTVKSTSPIGQGAGGFGGTLNSGDAFGSALTLVNDLNGDGVNDIAIGAPGDDASGTDAGAVWILFMRANGTVSQQRKIDGTSGGLLGAIDAADRFGSALDSPGDMDGDGIADLVVGAPGDDDGGGPLGGGSVWVVYLLSDGSVKGFQRISAGVGGFVGSANLESFGAGVSCIGDLDQDGSDDIAVGDPDDPDGAGFGQTRGALWLLLMNGDGTVRDEVKISSTSGNLTGPLPDGCRFGASVAPVGDIDQNGIPDLWVGAPMDPAGGAIWQLTLCEAAAMKTRNGGANPLSYSIAAPPVLGGTVTATVDLSTTGHSFAQILGFATPLEITLGSGQTLLVNAADPNGELLGQPLILGPQAVFSVPTPSSPSLCGQRIYTQAVHAFGVVPFALSNAIDVTLGF